MTENAASTLHRIHLTARVRIGSALVGCTGAKIDPSTGTAHAALDISRAGTDPLVVEVAVGEQILLPDGQLDHRRHPWHPPRQAGVEVRWWPLALPADRDASGGGTGASTEVQSFLRRRVTVGAPRRPHILRLRQGLPHPLQVASVFRTIRRAIPASRSTMEPSHSRHALIADDRDFPLLRLLLASFPPDAVGEVILELPDTAGGHPQETPFLPVPSGITVRNLRRSVDEQPGLAACTALAAWVEEWVLDEHATAEGHTIFVGMPDNALVEHCCERLLERRPGLHMHRPRRLGAPL